MEGIGKQERLASLLSWRPDSLDRGEEILFTTCCQFFSCWRMEDCSYCRWKHMLLHRCVKLRISVCRDAASFHSIAPKTQTNERQWIFLKGESWSGLWVVWWRRAEVIHGLNAFLTIIYYTRQQLRIWNIVSLGHL